MSDDEDRDGPELDDEDIASMMEDDPDSLTPEDIFDMVLLNKRDNKKVWVELKDKDGDKIELADMMAELINYIKDKMKQDDGKENQLVDQIMPLMSQALVSGLGRMIGINATGFYLTNPGTRQALLYMMMVSFILYKMVQSKGLTIHTFEEEVTDEEIAQIERKSNASSVANMSAMLGMNPMEALAKMVEKGDITQSDLEDLMGKAKKDGKSGS